MTRDQIIDLLTLCASFDRRTAGSTDVAAWKLAIGDLGFADAQAAVVEHYRESADWITPAHVRRGVRAAKQARANREVAAPPAELADDPPRYREALKANIAAAAEGFSIRRALKGAGSEGPPEVWRKAREAVGPAQRTPEEDALAQVAESRKGRHAEWDEPGAEEEGA